MLAVTVLHAGTAVAVLTAAVYLPWLVIGLPTGAWVDRLPVVVFATAYQVFLSALVMAGELVEGDAKLPGSVSVAAVAARRAWPSAPPRCCSTRPASSPRRRAC